MATLIQQEPEWIDTAPIQIRREVVVERSPSWVWDHLATDERWVDWFPGLRDCRYTTAAPHGEGSMRFVHQDQFKVNERITRWEPERRWGMTVVNINLPLLRSMAEAAVLTPEGESTRLSFAMGIDLSKIGRLLRGPLEARTAKSLDQALANLAERAARLV